MKRILHSQVSLGIFGGILGAIAMIAVFITISSVIAAPSAFPPDGNPTFPAAGAQGPQGVPGATGAQGSQGPAGPVNQGVWCGICVDNGAYGGFSCEGYNVCSSCPSGYARLGLDIAGASPGADYVCFKN